MSRSGKKKGGGGGGGGGGLGRAILKERNRGKGSHGGGSWLHTSELDDGYDWNKLNLRSVTEESQLDEFLRTAELAGAEFTAEKLNVRVVDPVSSRSGLPSMEEEREIEKLHSQFRQYIGIPRRPEWGPSTTVEQLELSERDSYLTWRRNLAQLEEKEGLIFTPFEKNLQFWRQLWRVIERSDVIVQIVDARNPLLFRCEDLEKYVGELSDKKVNLLLVSKADLLSWKQRLSWSQYFSDRDITAAFWSAKLAEDETKEKVDDIQQHTESENESERVRGAAEDEGGSGLSVRPDLLSREELLQLFITLSPVPGDKLTTVGLVGYPNVGKSTTINVLYTEKKVPVSATPGRTKHFQTLFISDHLVLCDCPGLVFPSLVTTKAEMIVSGILPIDHLRDHIPPVSLVCQRIPRSVLERVYGLTLPRPSEGEDPGRCPTALELLSAYGYLHGYMTSHGLPDCPRSARYILKDYVNGKLLFCHPPPGMNPTPFNSDPQHQTGLQREGDKSGPKREGDESGLKREGEMTPTTLAEDSPTTSKLSEFDKTFLQQVEVRAIRKGGHGMTGFTRKTDTQASLGTQSEEGAESEATPDTASVTSSVGSAGKPWKRHNNRHKKEKIRRTKRPLNPYT